MKSYQCYIEVWNEDLEQPVEMYLAGPAVYYRPEDAVAAAFGHSLCFDGQPVHIRADNGKVVASVIAGSWFTNDHHEE